MYWHHWALPDFEVGCPGDNRSTQFTFPREITITSPNESIFRVIGPLCGEVTAHRWIPLTKGQLRGALVFSLICAWTNSWANTRDAGVLRRHRVHYEVTVMIFGIFHVFKPPKGRFHVRGKNARETNTPNQLKLAQAIWNSCQRIAITIQVPQKRLWVLTCVMY